MSQVDSLELLLKIKSDGAQALKEATELTKTLSSTASSTAKALDQMQGAFTGQLEAMRRLSADILQALSSVAKATNDGRQKAEDAETRQQRAIERTIQLLERKAALAGKTGAARTGVQQGFFLEDYGKTEEGVNRINAAFSKLSQSQSSLPNFAAQIRQFVSNPMYAAGVAAQNLATGLGPVGLAITGVVAVATIGAVVLKKLADSLAADELAFKNFSIRTGLSITGTQQFIRVSQLAGVNAFALESSVRKLSEAFADGGLRGRKSADALTKIGLSAYNAAGQLRPMDALIPEILRKLGGISNIADRNVLSLQLLGRSGRELLPLIDNYDRFLEVVKGSGAVIDKDGIDKVEKYRFETELLALKWTALVNTLKQKAVGIVEFVISPGGLNTGQEYVEGALRQQAQNPKAFPGGVLGFATGEAQSRSGTHQYLSLDSAGQRQRDLAERADAVPDNLRTLEGQAAQRKAFAQNDRTVAGLIARNDPQLLLRKAEEELNTALDSLKKGVNPSANADVIKTLPGLKSAVERAKALIKGPQIDEEQARRLDESKAKELFGEQKITAEYEKQIDILKRAHVLTSARLEVEQQIRANNLARYNQELTAEQAVQTRNVTRALGGANVSVSRLFGNRSASIAEASGRVTPGSTEGIQQAFQIRKQAADQEFLDASRAIAQEKEEAEAIKDPIKKLQELGKIRVEQIEAAKKYAENYYNAETQHILDLIELEKKRKAEKAAADKQITEIGIGAQRSLIERQAQKTQSLLGNQFTGPGQEVQLAKAALQIRLQLTAQLFNSEINAAKLLEKADDRRVAVAHALKQAIDDTGSAQIQYEIQISELQKRRIEDARRQAGQFFDAISTRGGLRTLFPDLAKGFERQVFTNVTSGFFQQAGRIASTAIPGQRDANGNLTGVGRALQGTFLSPHDEQQTAIKTNTDRTVDNTLATAQLSQVIAQISGVTAPSVPGVPTVARGGSVAGGSSKFGGLATILGFGGLGAGIGTSLADTFSHPQEQFLTDPKTFKPSRFVHPGATIAGGIAGSLAGLGIDLFGKGGSSSSTGGPSGLTSSLQGNIDATRDLTTTIRDFADQIVTGTGGSGGSGGGIAGLGGGSEPTLADIPLRAAPSIFQLLGAPPGGGSSAPGFSTGLGNALKGGAPALWDAITGKDGTNINGKGQAFTGASRAGTIIGGAGVLIAGAEGVYGGIKQGGARGALGAIGSVAGTAAALDPEPISKAVLGGIALASGLIKSILGDPKVARQNSINLALQQEQYLAPTTINRTVDATGHNVAFDKYGHPVSTGGVGVNVTGPQETYFNGNYNVIPGNSTPNVGPSQVYGPTQAAQPTAAPQIHVNISAMDSQSILNRSADIGAAVYNELQKGGALGLRIQRMVLGS